MSPPAPRIALLSEEEAKQAAKAAGVPEFMARLSVFRVLLKNPRLAKALNDQTATLLWGGKLDPKLRELIIMRIGWKSGSLYEWTQHWGVAKGVGLSEEKLLAVREWENFDFFTEAERAVLAATDETMAAGVVSKETWERCRASVAGGDAALLEMVAAIGNWRLFSSLLRSLEIPLEEGAQPWPPDGKEPG